MLSQYEMKEKKLSIYVRMYYDIRSLDDTELQKKLVEYLYELYKEDVEVRNFRPRWWNRFLIDVEQFRSNECGKY